VKGKMLVIVAILLGVVVVFLVNSRFKEYEDKANPVLKVLYKAAADIEPGVTTVQTALGEAKLLQPVKEVPASFANANPDFVDSEIEWAKKLTITRAIRAGDFLRMSHLQALSSAEVVAAIPDGKVLYNIKVDQQTSVGYLVGPGDLVDVYAVSTKPDPGQPGGVAIESPLLASDLLVFAVDATMLTRDGTRARRPGTPYTSVTFAVTTAEHAKLLAAAQRSAKLSLTLKSKKQG